MFINALLRVLEGEFTEDKSNILLVGNGISQCFYSKSWEDIIRNCIEKYDAKYEYEDISGMPANMQIVLATNNKISTEMKSLQEKYERPVSDEYKEYVLNLFDLPISEILTTNYDYDVEQAFSCGYSKYNFQKCRHWTKDNLKVAEKNSNIYQYSLCKYNDREKHIWHIHGDICNRESMIMGHYYYGKRITEIQKYLSIFMRQYNGAKTKGIEYQPKSWIDYFLLSDVFVVGLGLYLTESDLWWLIEFKRQHFRDTKIYYYQSKNNLNVDVRRMLRLYDVEIIDDIPLKGYDYKAYYNDVRRDILKRIER